MNPLYILVLLFIGALADLLALPGRAWQAVRTWWIREGWLLALIGVTTAAIMLLFGVGMSYGQQRLYISAFGSAPGAIGAQYANGSAVMAGLQFEERIKWVDVQLTAAYDFTGYRPYISFRMGAAFGKRDKLTAVAYPFPYMNLTPDIAYTAPIGAELRWRDKAVVGMEYDILKGRLYPAVRLRCPVMEFDSKKGKQPLSLR